MKTSIPSEDGKKFSPASFVDGVLDQIIAAVSLTPDAVLAEYDARGITCPDGMPLETLAHIREHVTSEQARAVSLRFINTYAKMAAGQGFFTGLGGLITLPVTVPTDIAAYIAWLARSASAVQLAHGHDTMTPTGDAQLKLAMLVGSGVTALTVDGVEILVVQLAKKVMTTPYAKAPVQAAVKALAAKVGVQLGHKSFAKAVPVIGGVVNGTVHGTLVKMGGNRILNHYQALASGA